MFISDVFNNVNNQISGDYGKPISVTPDIQEEQDRFVKVAPDMEKSGQDESPAYELSISPEAKQIIEDANKMPGESSDEQAKDKEEEETRTAQEPWRKGKSKEEQKSVEEKARQLKQREMDVIKHENAHKAVGGQYAGGISYEKASGPDGKQYIVGGSVPIDVSAEGSPEKTVAKMKIVRRAALAPANPSDADRAVAATAASQEAAALKQMSAEKMQNNQDSMKKSADAIEKNRPAEKISPSKPKAQHKRKQQPEEQNQTAEIKSYIAQKTLKHGYSKGSLLDLSA